MTDPSAWAMKMAEKIVEPFEDDEGAHWPWRIRVIALTLDAAVAEKDARIRELEAALSGLMIGPAELDDILWGDQPDSAPMKTMLPLGVYRRARAAIRARGESK